MTVNASQLFNHNTPSAPALSAGMLLGASGVTHPPLQTLGVMTGLSSANGSFSDILGKGQIDYDSAGYLYVCDTTNNRVQRFSVNSSGVFVYDSQCSSANALGSPVNMEMVAIDRSRNQIHLGSSAQNVSNTLIGVWDLSSWPNLTTGNRIRSYGTASGSNGSGNLRAPHCLTLIGDVAIVCSSAGDYRVIKYNHVSVALVAEDTNSLWKSRFASDGTKYYSGAQATDTELGLWTMNTSTLAGTLRLDSSTPAGANHTRQNHLVQGGGGDITDLVYHNNRIYVRTLLSSRLLAWETAGDTFLDEFLWPGGALASESLGHSPGYHFTPQIQTAKIGVYGAPNATKSDYLLMWSANARNTATQSFLTIWPMSTSLATWTKTDWSAGTNTLQGMLVNGANLSDEKYKIRLRKNSGSWITFNADTLRDSSFFTSLGTFTAGDTLTVELSLSTWDRLDFLSGATATRDKLSPANVSIELFYYDTAAITYVPYAASSSRMRQGIAAASRVRRS